MATRWALVLTALVIASTAKAQGPAPRGECSDDRSWGWGGPQARACVIRDLTVPASGRLSTWISVQGPQGPVSPISQKLSFLEARMMRSSAMKRFQMS